MALIYGTNASGGGAPAPGCVGLIRRVGVRRAPSWRGKPGFRRARSVPDRGGNCGESRLLMGTPIWSLTWCAAGRTSAADELLSSRSRRYGRRTGGWSTSAMPRTVRWPARSTRAAVWVAVHRRAVPSKGDRSRALVQAEPIETATTRAANAARARAQAGVTTVPAAPATCP
jgi:hypothetical protein